MNPSTVLHRLALVGALAATALVAPVAAAQAPGKPAAQPKPFAAGDAALGKTLVDNDCVACHAKRFGGDADAIYLRPDRRVHTPEQLLAQVRMCNTQLGKSYFPEEEEHVAAYLNLKYYKFPP
jgi:mono/diheme cytochrome c family protein